MIKLKVFKKDDIYSDSVTEVLEHLHEKIFLTSESVDRKSKIARYIHSPATIKKVAIYYNNNEPIGFMCMQRYEMILNGEKVNVFRGQAGLLEMYRRKNITKLTYLLFIVIELLKHPRNSFFFATCIHPSSYCSILKENYIRVNTWPTKENLDKNEHLKFLCEKACYAFGLKVNERDGVFIYNDGQGPTRPSKEARKVISNDAEFFIKINPGYINGDGVATIVKVTIKNILLHLTNQLVAKLNKIFNIKEKTWLDPRS